MVSNYNPVAYVIVPARGGSKGIPKKNLAILDGHPLVSYSIAVGRALEGVARVICSTDSPEIAEVARSYGAEVPALRPLELSQDGSTDLEVFDHLVSEFDRVGEAPDVLIQLRPTTPLRRIRDIQDALKKFVSSADATSLRGVTEPKTTPYKMWTYNDAAGTLAPLLTHPCIDEPFNVGREKLPNVYVQTGYVDIFKVDTIKKYKSMTGPRVIPYFHDPRLYIDIDSQKDLELANLVIRNEDCFRF